KDVAAQLADAFELSMYKLTLLGNHLPSTAEGLTPQQLKLLTILAFADSPLAMATAAARVGVTPGTLTEGVKRLVKIGYVERRRSTDDDRVVELSLSEQGVEIIADIRAHRVAFFRDVCKQLNATECHNLISSHQLIAETYTRIVQAKIGGAQ